LNGTLHLIVDYDEENFNLLTYKIDSVAMETQW